MVTFLLLFAFANTISTFVLYTHLWKLDSVIIETNELTRDFTSAQFKSAKQDNSDNTTSVSQDYYNSEFN